MLAVCTEVNSNLLPICMPSGNWGDVGRVVIAKSFAVCPAKFLTAFRRLTGRREVGRNGVEKSAAGVAGRSVELKINYNGVIGEILSEIPRGIPCYRLPTSWPAGSSAD